MTRRTAENKMRKEWRLTKQRNREPLTFIERPVRCRRSPFLGTAVDDVHTCARFVRQHGRAPLMVQQAAEHISCPSQMLLVLGWLSEIRSELSDEMLEIAGGLNPHGRGIAYFVWSSQYAFPSRQSEPLREAA